VQAKKRREEDCAHDEEDVKGLEEEKRFDEAELPT
jgi:hypothetical protein